MAQYELNVIDYWLIVKKRKYLILLAAGLVVLFTFLFSELFKPSPLYEASARVKFDRTSTVAQQLIESMSFSNANDLNSQTEFIRGFPVMERVAMELERVPANASPQEKKSASYLNTVYNLGQEIMTTAGRRYEYHSHHRHLRSTGDGGEDGQFSGQCVSA